jgi:hypothetical protein
MRTVSAAIKAPLALNPMADNAASTVRARRSKLLDGALKAIKGIAPPIHDDVKSLIVVVVAR